MKDFISYIKSGWWWTHILAIKSIIIHKIFHPSHKIIWKISPEEFICPGDIVCETCDVVYWCRSYNFKYYKNWIKELEKDIK